MQNDTIHKDLSILVIDGGYGFGNNKLIPAGPLRESVKSSSTKIDFIVFVNDPAKNVKMDLSVFKCPILQSNIETIADNIDLNKIDIISRGVNIESFEGSKFSNTEISNIKKMWSVDDNKIIILFPARLTRWKGHLVTIEAINLL